MQRLISYSGLFLTISIFITGCPGPSGSQHPVNQSPGRQPPAPPAPPVSNDKKPDPKAPQKEPIKAREPATPQGQPTRAPQNQLPAAPLVQQTGTPQVQQAGTPQTLQTGKTEEQEQEIEAEIDAEVEALRILREKSLTAANDYLNNLQVPVSEIAITTPDGTLALIASVDQIKAEDLFEGAFLIISNSDPFVSKLNINFPKEVAKSRLLVWDFELLPITERNGVTLYEAKKDYGFRALPQTNLAVAAGNLKLISKSVRSEIYKWSHEGKTYALKVAKDRYGAYETSDLERLQFTGAAIGFYGLTRINGYIAFVIELGDFDLSQAIASKHQFTADEILRSAQKMQLLVTASRALNITYTDVNHSHLICVKGEKGYAIKATGFGSISKKTNSTGLELGRALLEATTTSKIRARQGNQNPSPVYEKYLARRAVKDVLSQASSINNLRDLYNSLTPAQRIQFLSKNEATDHSVVLGVGLLMPQFDNQLDWKQWRSKLDAIYDRLESGASLGLFTELLPFIEQGKEAFMKRLKEDDSLKKFILDLYEPYAVEAFCNAIESHFETKLKLILEELSNDLLSDRAVLRETIINLIKS